MPSLRRKREHFEGRVRKPQSLGAGAFENNQSRADDCGFGRLGGYSAEAYSGSNFVQKRGLIVKGIKGYKNPALQAVFNDEEVVFTDISTEEDKISEVQRFKAELIEQTYSANDMLYVSAVYEKVNNLWWILLLSIGLPLFVVAITISTIFIKIYKKGRINKEEL